MKIGDKSPFPTDASIELALYRQRRRGRLAKLANGKGNNQVANGARKIVAEMSENAKRDLNPFHRAVTFLGRKGYIVFHASVRKTGAKGYIVGRLTVPDQKAVLAIARRRGWPE
jgi:hypothetical protein